MKCICLFCSTFYFLRLPSHTHIIPVTEKMLGCVSEGYWWTANIDYQTNCLKRRRKQGMEQTRNL